MYRIIMLLFPAMIIGTDIPQEPRIVRPARRVPAISSGAHAARDICSLQREVRPRTRSNRDNQVAAAEGGILCSKGDILIFNNRLRVEPAARRRSLNFKTGLKAC